MNGKRMKKENEERKRKKRIKKELVGGCGVLHRVKPPLLRSTAPMQWLR